MASEAYNFCTGSSYIGDLDREGKMSGFGTYRFPNGTKYVGHFKTGKFHGLGMIVHPSKFKLCGTFVDGKCDCYETFFGDGLEYRSENWDYFKSGDRRFWIEIVRGIPPVGEQFRSEVKPARPVPRGQYDAIEGLFDPKSEFIVDSSDGQRKRYVCPEEKDRILQYYRMNEIDFNEQEDRAAAAKSHNISTDSLVSSDDQEDYYFDFN